MSGSNPKTPFPLGVFPNAPDNSNPANEASFEATYTSFVSGMNAVPQFLDTFLDYRQPVSAWVGNAGFSASSIAQSADAKGMTPVIALPMASIASGSGTPDQQYQAFASGQYDGVLQGIVQAYSAQGFKSLVFRPGWEMNLAGPTYAGDSAQSQADWVKAFQHVYTVLHQAAAAQGVAVQVVWNPGTTNYSNAEATTNLYPGDQFVDSVGADIYGDIYPYSDSSPTSTYHDWSTGQELTSASQFIANPVDRMHYWSNPAGDAYTLDGSGGHSQSLNSIIAFAEQHGKPLAIPETGAGNSGSGADVADDAAFPQWLAQQLAAAQAAGEPINFVNIWDSNGGGNYEFSSPSDGKPQEAAAWSKYFGGQTVVPLAHPQVTFGSGHDAIVLSVSEDAYQGDALYTVAVDGVQIGGLQTASASHAAGQSQQVVLNGDWGDGTHVVSVNFTNDAYGGSAAADRNLYVNGAAMNGAAPTGSLALLSSGPASLTVGAPAPAATVLGSGRDTLALLMNEDRYQGDAQFTVSVDGTQVGGTQTVVASHAAGQAQLFDVDGSFGAGQHSVSVNFVNDAYGGTPLADRNLYVAGASFDGVAAPAGTLTLLAGGAQALTVGVAVPATVAVGSGGDTIALSVSEDAYQGDAQFTVSVDGHQVGGTLTAQAAHAAGQDQVFDVQGDFGAGTHAVAVDFLNDAYAGTPSTDRNLYVDGASADGSAVAAGRLALMSAGTQSFGAAIADTLTLGVSEDAYQGDAQFTVSVDGHQVGGTRTVSALHGAGQSQAVTLAGTWGLGSHVVAVNFLNDLYAGTPATDRNLYVTSASYDGAAAGESVAQFSAGATPFTVTSATAYAPGDAGGSITTLGNDTVHAGAGLVSIVADGPSVSVVGGSGGLSFLGSGGNDAVLGGAGGITLAGGGDRLSFTAGTGAASITAGSGHETYTIVDGKAGGSLGLAGFTTGLDTIHLQGYPGSGVASMSSLAGSTQIVLADRTQVTLVGVTGLTAAQIFS